jgi:hypothetical protein
MSGSNPHKNKFIVNLQRHDVLEYSASTEHVASTSELPEHSYRTAKS